MIIHRSFTCWRNSERRLRTVGVVVAMLALLPAMATAQSTYDGLIREAQELLARQKVPEALIKAKSAIQVDGERPEAYETAGRIAHQLGDRQAASAFLQSALQRAPDDERRDSVYALRREVDAAGLDREIKARLAEARRASKEGDRSVAAQAYFDAWRMNPADAPVGFEAADALVSLGDHARALQILTELTQQVRAHARESASEALARGNDRFAARDYAGANSAFHDAVRLGSPEAAWMLGFLYANGLGVPKDAQEALHWYRRAAEGGHAGAMFDLAGMFAEGQGVPKNAEEAVRWYRRAAEAGHGRAMYGLATMYANGQGVAKDSREVLRWFHRAAEVGLATAMASLGETYLYGRGVVKDEEEAARWFRRAADAGDALAMFNMGALYASGQGVPRDDKEAVRWYRAGADAGNAGAMYNLGVMYANGQGGLPKNPPEALRWFRRAAEAGVAPAMVSLGGRYFYGRDVKKDEQEAVRWFRRAADLGDAEAMFNLGVLSAKGLGGIAKSEEEALRWFRRAAEAGDPDAMYSLGRSYETGQGIAKSLTEAMKWYRRAAGRGLPSAIERLRVLGQEAAVRP